MGCYNSAFFIQGRLFGKYTTRETALRWKRKTIAFTMQHMLFYLLAWAFSKATSLPSHPHYRLVSPLSDTFKLMDGMDGIYSD